VTYEKGEPICMIVPQRRGEIEQFQPVLTSITNKPELAEEWRAATDSRNDHVSLINAARGELGCYIPHALVKKFARYQGFYMSGRYPDGSTAVEHQTRVKLRTFEVR
jgi:hypothetical protein